mgnify:CR=1 FL=1
MIADIHFKNWSTKINKVKCQPRVKTWKLRDCSFRSKFENLVAERLDHNSTWPDFKNTLLNTVQEVCGTTKGNNQKRFNETWWFNEEVRYAIKTKKEAYRKWQKSLADEDKENYRISRQEAKRVVAIAKNVALQEIWSGKSNQENCRKSEILLEQHASEMKMVKCLSTARKFVTAGKHTLRNF